MVFGLAKGGIDAMVAAPAAAGVEIVTPVTEARVAGQRSSKTLTTTCSRCTRTVRFLVDGRQKREFFAAENGIVSLG